MRLAVANSKGGTGKTTLAALLALSLHRARRVVSVRDYDEQQGLIGWLEHVEKKGVPLQRIGAGHVVIGEGAPTHEIGDFPPESPGQLAARVADWERVLVPTRPSPIDVKSAAAFIKALPDPNRALVLWNCLDTSNLSHPDALAAMLKPHGLRALAAGLKARAAYRYAQSQGIDALGGDARTELVDVGMEVFA